MFYFSHAGLSIRSELTLPEWEIFQQGQFLAEPQIVFTLASPTTPPAEWNLPQMSPGYARFVVPGVACYEVNQGRAVIVTPNPGARTEEVRLYLLGAAWAVLCYQRQLLPLHAGVVGTANGAVAFCGPSGAGKSTVTTWLIRQGHTLLGDDLCICEVPPNGETLMWPSAPRLKLWSNALDHFGLVHVDLPRDLLRYDKFHLPWTTNHLLTPLPLRALYLLTWGEPSISRLRGVDALVQLVTTASYRAELLEPLEQLGPQWERCAELVRRVPIWQFSRPQDWSGFESAMQMLASHLAINL